MHTNLHLYAQLIVNAGGVGALVDYVTEARGNAALPGIMALGYISAFSETLALAVVVSKGIPPLVNAVVAEPEVSTWTIYTYICIYMCIHMCVYVCIYIVAEPEVYTFTCACVYVCIYICVYMYMHMYINVCVCVCVYLYGL